MRKRKSNNPQKRRRYGCVAAFVLTAVCCAGCTVRTPDNDNLIITEKEPEKVQYTLTAVSKGDVILTERIKCVYRQTEEEEISFSVSSRRISKILVRKGDIVEKGQILAELEDNRADDRIAQLEYQIERNSLLIEHSDVNENYEISARWLRLWYRSGGSDEEEEAMKESIRQLQQNGQYQRQDYQDAIDLDRMELEKLRQENAESRVYAGMNGTVSWIRDNLEGTTCTRDEVIMRINGGSECVFIVEGAEYAELFEEGVPVEMNINLVGGASRYELLPYKMDEWGDKLTFSVPEQYDTSVIKVGASGTIRLVLDTRENVLTLPKSAVHTADGKPYVYVVGEGDLREVRWIETGLYGDESVEIREGLEQGEKVIIR